MDADEPVWVPPRPGRVVEFHDARPRPVPLEPPPVVAVPTAPPPRRRRSLARRLLSAYAAGAAVIGLVVGAGVLLQPVYGSEAPYGGTTYPDVRSAPTAVGWSFSLAKAFAPGMPPACLTYQAGGVDEHRELVTAQLPAESPMGPNEECEKPDPATDGRLVMLDPATGRVLWRRSLATDLKTSVFSLVWHASESAGAVVVGIDGSRGDFLVSLDLNTGRTISSTTVSTPDAVINFAVSDHLVVSIVPGSGGAVDAYSLRRTNALTKPLWSAAVSSALLPELLPDRFVVPTSTGTVSVDGTTGRVTAWGTDLRDLTSVRVSGDRVLAQTIPSGVGLAPSVVLLNSSGKVLWGRPASAIMGLTVSRGCVVVESGANEVTCLAPATGRERWSTEDDGIVVGTPNGSTTSDIESIGEIHQGDTQLIVSEIDGSTGRERFEASLPRGTNVVGQGIATGYALGATTENGASTLTAFDLASGRQLWSISRPELDVWGGRLIEITKGGVARELTDPGTTTVESERSSAAHDMLVG